MRVMGVHCEGGMAHLAFLDEGEPVKDAPVQIAYAVGQGEERQLQSALEEAGRILAEARPDKVVILRPTGKYQATHQQLTPRIAMETVIRLACATREIPVQMIARETVKSSLGLPRPGALDKYLDDVFPVASGPHWKQGRGLAALAAKGAN